MMKNKQTKLLFLSILILLISCSVTKNKSDVSMKNHIIRLKPGEDLLESIQRYVLNNQIEAGWMVTCAGSLTDYSIRMANQPDATIGSGHFEIVSLTGTLSNAGAHLHLCISDSTGKTIGGHMMTGNKIYTTAEIVIQSDSSFTFTREQDGSTPWKELQIRKKKS